MVAAEDRYLELHKGSATRYETAKSLFPDGVTHDTRWVTPFPLFMTHGKGPYKWDVDNNKINDFVMGHGSMILGHAHPDVVSAVQEAASRGSHLGGNTEQEMAWAQLVCDLVPAAEKVRFTMSGTEASLLAFRLARAYSGKTKLLKFRNNFHGWHDYSILGEGRGMGGVPEAAKSTMIVADPDLQNVEEILSKDKDIAAVILEPSGANAGWLPFSVDFLKGLRDLTTSYNVVLIFDEVVTGFRYAPGGAQDRFNITPDMSIHAKAMSGGYPAGAVVGKAEILDMIQHRGDPKWDSSSRVSHPGTFNANPIVASAGVAALNLIANHGITQHAEEMAGRLRSGARDILARLEIPATVYGVASVFYLIFGVSGESDDNGICTLPHDAIRNAADPDIYRLAKVAFLNEGIDFMRHRAIFGLVSGSHTPSDIDHALEGFERGLKVLQGEGIV